MMAATTGNNGHAPNSSPVFLKRKCNSMNQRESVGVCREYDGGRNTALWGSMFEHRFIQISTAVASVNVYLALRSCNSDSGII